MAEIDQYGMMLMTHVKAYIDERLGVPDDSDDAGTDSSATQTTGFESFFDPFSVNLSPLSLSLPEAFNRVVAVLSKQPDRDFVIVRVSDAGWEGFYRKLLQLSQDYPEFLATATNIQERFQFVSAPDNQYQADISVIRAGDNYSVIGDWVGQYDQVYTAVLVMQFEAGQVPEVFTS